jgi:hypothetical protein
MNCNTLFIIIISIIFNFGRIFLIFTFVQLNTSILKLNIFFVMFILIWLNVNDYTKTVTLNEFKNLCNPLSIYPL